MKVKVELPLPPQVVLSILAPSYLLTHEWGESLINALIESGRWSEELFRGDRLPTLPFPQPIHPDEAPSHSQTEIPPHQAP